eukprot:CAMPEP_0201571534 /NCGR_PEP_ID=MMETSP0190_2-20130828/14363_1 /ASSEMBLY_ACC=CAM_ASM_000263 /TAXON_ID=37353 /ORGANISM="Rosalina sp." /LENGTH=155 /DNA_ID=CAMNT_0047996299 /DNA_START=1084 /DNA_END=1551 /DNA_ORIENTATION=-
MELENLEQMDGVVGNDKNREDNNHQNGGDIDDDGYIKMETPDTMTVSSPNTPKIIMLSTPNNEDMEIESDIDINVGDTTEHVMRLPSSSVNKLKNHNRSNSSNHSKGNKNDENDLSSPIMRDDATSKSLNSSGSNHSSNAPEKKPDFYTLESTRL